MVRIITDSAADFEPEELQRLNITCIPLTVSFGDAAKITTNSCAVGRDFFI